MDQIRVMFVKAKAGTAGAKEAFDTLESKLSSLRGRRFYGAYDPLTREYRACVETIQDENAASLGLESWIIPGGKYMTRKVNDWHLKIRELPQMFEEMARSCEVDLTRPSLEHYRSERELILYLPIQA